MIQAFIEMPIETQTWLVLSVGWVMLATSAAIREKSPPGECRNWARAMGVVGVLLMSLQTIHTTMIAEELNTELMVRRGTHDVEETEAVATQISDPVRVVAVASEYSATTKAGNKVSVTRFCGGRFGSMSVIRGRGGFNTCTDRCEVSGIGDSGSALGGSNGLAGSLQNRASGSVSF